MSIRFASALFKVGQKATKLYSFPVEASILILKLLLVVSVSFQFLLFLDSLEFWENSCPAILSIILELEVRDKTSVEIEVEIVNLVFYVLVPDACFTTSIEEGGESFQVGLVLQEWIGYQAQLVGAHEVWLSAVKEFAHLLEHGDVRAGE